ncbi:MAG TPA: lamin tail domain-containing protein, partial [Polyangiaceae bacterium]
FTYGDDLQLSNTSDVVRLTVANVVIDEVSYSSNAGYPDFAGASLTLVGTPDAGQNDVAGAWCAAGTRFGAGDFGTPGAANGACLRYGAALATGDVVITEIMPNPRAVLDNLGEWFEVYNPGPGAVDLEGVTVSDLAEDGFTVGASLLINAGDYAVFGLNGTIGTNGGIAVDYVYPEADFTLANGTNGDEVVIAYAGTLIDKVAYLQTFSFGNGISMSLSPGGTAITNDAAANWCAASTTLGSEDRGTPGLANDTCP